MRTCLFAGAALAGIALPVLVPSVLATAPQHAPVAGRHERVLPLEGGQNFRDLGGYRTADGHTVKWGVLFRSGSMHFLTAKDHAYLTRIGIRTVCDMRDNAERALEPVVWPAGNAPSVLADDYQLDMKAIGMTAPTTTPTVADAGATMRRVYPRLLERFNGQYRRMFGALLAGQVPLAFNCTAGKDRTGVAAALLLTALGVPRRAVIEDFTLTDRYFDPAKVVRADSSASAQWRALPRDVLKAYMAADPAYIAEVFKVMDAHPGGVRGYLRDEMGLGDTEIARLRAAYLD